MLTGCRELKLHMSRTNRFIRDMLIYTHRKEGKKNTPSWFKGKTNAKQTKPHQNKTTRTVPSPLQEGGTEKGTLKENTRKLLNMCVPGDKEIIVDYCHRYAVHWLLCVYTHAYAHLCTCLCIFKTNKKQLTMQRMEQSNGKRKKNP